MVQLYRDTVDTRTNQVVETGVKVNFPNLESYARTAINKALKAETIPTKVGFLEFVYYNDREWEKANKEPNPGEMK